MPTPTKVKKLKKPEPMPVEFHMVEDAFNKVKSAEGPFRYFLSTFQGYSKDCSIKAYSVQDQQAAGCKGNDTVEQCMEKLYDFCMSKLNQPGFQAVAEKELAASRELVKRAQAYANHVEHMLNTFGK
jgi:hypothetical protein